MIDEITLKTILENQSEMIGLLQEQLKDMVVIIKEHEKRIKELEAEKV